MMLSAISSLRRSPANFGFRYKPRSNRSLTCISGTAILLGVLSVVLPALPVGGQDLPSSTEPSPLATLVPLTTVVDEPTEPAEPVESTEPTKPAQPPADPTEERTSKAPASPSIDKLRTAARPSSSSPSTFDTMAQREREYMAIAAEVAALERQTNLLKRVVRLVQPTVVHLEAKKKRPVVRYHEDSKPIEEAGSGVVVRLNKQLYIITNRHVIANSSLSDITIRVADGQRITAKSVLTDRASDLALLAIPNDSPVLPARLGDSDKLEMGDYVLAVGSPFGLRHSVTFGIVSAKGRRDLEVGANGVQYQDFIQTDAAINPGNSGGPLLNLRGEVVGINTAIFSASGGNEGIGFALPINMVSFVTEELVKSGRVARAYLGVHLDSRFDDDAAAKLGLTPPYGARVSGVTPNSPAARARLQVGDVIVQFNQTSIEDDTHLINLVSTTRLGARVQLTILRKLRRQRVELVVSSRSDFEADAAPSSRR